MFKKRLRNEILSGYNHLKWFIKIHKNIGMFAKKNNLSLREVRHVMLLDNNVVKNTRV